MHGKAILLFTVSSLSVVQCKWTLLARRHFPRKIHPFTTRLVCLRTIIRILNRATFSPVFSKSLSLPSLARSINFICAPTTTGRYARKCKCNDLWNQLFAVVSCQYTAVRLAHSLALVYLFAVLIDYCAGRYSNVKKKNIWRLFKFC